MNKIIFFLLLSISFLTRAGVAGVDEELRKQLDFFSVKSIPIVKQNPNRYQFELGKRLFISNLLSGNKDISCMTCHNPKFGTSDNKMLSQTHDGKSILRRNSPTLFNLGLPSRNDMFHDGRVKLNPSEKSFTTPELAFNGKNPARKDITSKMTMAVSMQALFPMVNNDEMRGLPGQNEIADAKNNLEAWDLLVKRVSKNSDIKKYIDLAYPNQEINIGNLGEAIGQFIAEEFYSNGSPFHQYLAGNNKALSDQEKKGLDVFMNRGLCIACHQGGELGLNNFYASVGVPQFGAKPFKIDYGRAEVSGFEDRKLFFKTPSLLNLAVSAPYMHNGAYATIRDVINHYSNIRVFLDSYDLNPTQRDNLPIEVEVLNDARSRNEIFNSIQAPFLRRGLNLTESEKDDLEAFLSNGLLDPKFKNFYFR